jgi:predicted MFS family arabinose efflux permease
MSSESNGTESAAEVPASVLSRERTIVLVLAAMQFTSIVDFMVLMPLGEQLMRTLHIKPKQFGLIVACYTISAGIVGLIASTFVDRFDRKFAFLVLYSGFLVGTAFCGVSNTYHTLMIARAVTGGFGGLLGGLALAIIGDVVPEERRGKATGALMLAFALASVAGVPLGLYLGTKFGWQVPFLLLAAAGSPILLISILVLPPLREHIQREGRGKPLGEFWGILSHPNHVRAYLLVVTLMLGAFSVIPYIGPYLVANVKLREAQLPLVYITGGVFTLIAAPIIGRMADRYGKLAVYRVIAPFSAVMMYILTNLTVVSVALAAVVFGSLMVSNAGRMIAALAMVTGSVEKRRRGGFMSIYSSIQHLSNGIGAAIGGMILVKQNDGTYLHFDQVGWIAIVTTLLSLWFAGRLRLAEEPSSPTTTARSLGAAEEAMGDAIDAQALTESV